MKRTPGQSGVRFFFAVPAGGDRKFVLTVKDSTLYLIGLLQAKNFHREGTP
jgi:hypothetical protein